MRYNKYNAKKVEIDGIPFDSLKEAARYKELKLLERAKEITDLKENGIAYVADFKYFDKAKGRTVVEDVKGYKTDVYKIKRKLFLSMYCGDGILFIES